MRTQTQFLLLFILLTYSGVYAQQNPTSEQLKVQRVMQDIFETFSSADIVKFEQAVTPDLTIIERGEIWTLDTIRMYFKKTAPC